MFDTDVFVLGGGPAGLAAAIAARRAGFRVVLADADRPPIDKACGEGLLPDSLVAAAHLGIRLPSGAGMPFQGIRFEGHGHRISAKFPYGAGLGVRRTVLQPLLIQTAQRAGIQMLWGTHVMGVTGNVVQFGKNQMTSRWIVGADGAQSSVRRWAGLDSFRRNSPRFSYRRHYFVLPWSNYVEIYWGDRAQFYVTPVGPREVCLVLMTRDPHQRIAEALPEFPELAARLAHRTALTPERGALAATRTLRGVVNGNVALVGDASGTVDPITGEGLCLAFKQALALADALLNDNLGRYQQAHRQIVRRPQLMADFMLLMDRSGFLRRRTWAALAAHPDLFASLLAIHVGKLTPVRFAATAASLGWRLVTA